MRKKLLITACCFLSYLGVNAQYFNPDKVFYKAGFESQEEFSQWKTETSPALEEGTSLWGLGNPGWQTFSEIEEISTQSLSFNITSGQHYETSLVSPVISNDKSDLIVGFYGNGLMSLFPMDKIYAYFEISIDNGKTWETLYDSDRDRNSNAGIFIKGWNYFYYNLSSDYNKKDFRLRFRIDAKEYSAYMTNVYIDGVFASLKYDQDVSLTLLNPININAGFTESETVKATVKNVGSQPISSYQISYQVDDNQPVVETVNQTIAPGKSLEYSFNEKANLGEYGKEYNIIAKVELQDDGDLSNNEISGYIKNITTGIPYYPVFHEITVYPSGIFAKYLKDEWQTDTDDDDAFWQQGGDIKNGEAPYWSVQPANAKENVCTAILRSRPIHLEKGKYYDLNFNAWSALNENKTNKLAIYITKDRFGKENLTSIWNNETIDDTNTLSSSARFDIPESGNYYLAFHCTSPKGADELRIGNIYVIEAPALDVKLAKIIVPELHKFIYTDSETVKVNLVNNGVAQTIAAGTVKINMSLNGGETITETVPDAIAQGEEKIYTLNAKLNLLDKRASDILRIWTTLENDGNAKNDTLTQTLVSNVVSAPYTADFNGSITAAPKEMEFWEIVDSNKDGITFAPKKSQWGTDYTFDYGNSSDIENTDEFLYSRPLYLKKGHSYKIQYRAVISGEENEMKLQTVLYKLTANGSSKQQLTVLHDNALTGSNTLKHVIAIEEDAIYCIGFHITREEAVNYTFSLSSLSAIEVVAHDIALSNVILPGTYISAYNRLPVGLSVTNAGTEVINSVILKVSSPSLPEPITEVVQKEIKAESNATLYFTEPIAFTGTETEAWTFEVSIEEGDARPENNSQTINIHYLDNATIPYSAKFKEEEGFLSIDKNKDANRFRYASNISGSGMLNDNYSIFANNAKEDETDALAGRSLKMRAGKIYKVSFQYLINTSSAGEITPKLKIYALNIADTSQTGIARLVNSGTANNPYTYTGYLTVPEDGIYCICFATLKGYMDISLRGTFSIAEVTEKPDLELVEILTPAESSILGETEDVIVKIKTETPMMNLGGIPFSCEVADTVYYSSYDATLNKIQQEATITFKNVNLNVPGDYKLTIKADMQTDATPENNVISKMVKSLPIIEMEVLSIDNLQSGKLTQETITATVRNNGKGIINEAPISYTISREGVSDVLVEEVIKSPIAEGKTFQYSFSQKADLSAEGTYTIKVQVKIPDESNPENDLQEINIVSSLKNMDAGVAEISAPTEGLLSKEETVTVKIKNFGEVDLYNVPVSATVKKGKNLIKELSATVTEIKIGETKEVTFPETVDMYMFGEYVITARTSLSNDDKAENDIYETTIKAYKIDCGVTEITAPAENTEVGLQSITITVKNLGEVTVEKIPVRYKTGTMPISGEIEGPLAPGEKLTYTFPTQYRFQEKEYTLSAYTELEGDMDTDNDSISKKIIASPNSIDNNEAVSLSIYPNPAKDIVNIEADKELQTLTIYDSKGNLINTYTNIQATHYTLKVSHLPKDMFFLSVETNESKTIHKLIKE